MDESKNNPKPKGRMIRKDVSKSDKFASLSTRAQLLFLMLIPHLDSHGKMNGSPFFIKGEVVPKLKAFTPKIIERLLKEISARTNVKHFKSNGLEYIQSLSWKEHQTLRVDRLGEDDKPCFNSGTNSRTTPDILPLEVKDKVEVEVEVKAQAQPSADKPPERFEEFWKTYPNRKAKGNAEKVWRKLKPNAELFNKILAGVERAKLTHQWQKDDGDFIPHPATWLNSRGWEDEGVEVKTGGLSVHGQRTAEAAKRILERDANGVE